MNKNIFHFTLFRHGWILKRTGETDWRFPDKIFCYSCSAAFGFIKRRRYCLAYRGSHGKLSLLSIPGLSSYFASEDPRFKARLLFLPGMTKYRAPFWEHTSSQRSDCFERVNGVGLLCLKATWLRRWKFCSTWPKPIPPLGFRCSRPQSKVSR